MKKIVCIDRADKREFEEKVYGGVFLRLLYGSSLFSAIVSWLLLPFIARWPLTSWLYGWIQKRPFSRRKIAPFVQQFQIDESEFADPVQSYASFNDFFIRKLKPQARPIDPDPKSAVLPADARYLVYPNVQKADGFVVKGKRFSLEKLLNNPELARRYTTGSMVIARLCPADYHRFHFPCDGVAGAARLINGALFSVNPLALHKNIEIFTENKRVVTEVVTDRFGTMAYVEIGATHVGSITQTYVPGKRVFKGEEKGFFSFGGSSLILLFEPGVISFSEDLLEASSRRQEMRALMGQVLGK